MPTELGATALSAGLNFIGNLGGSVSGGLFSANQARKNRAFQERMYNKQVEDNIKFWNMQNEYNLPSAQLERLRDAGLNPLLMYGEGGLSGNIAQSAIQSGTAPHGAQGHAESFNTRIDFANLALLEAQAKALDAQAENNYAQADSQESYKKQLDFYNSINEDTKAIQIAIKYRDLDYLNARIQESWNNVFQSHFVNGSQMASLSLMNSLAIREQNLNEYEVGNNVLMSWEFGKIHAQAALKSAFAQMMQAQTAAKIAPYTIGVMRQTASKLANENKLFKDTYGDRVTAFSLMNKYRAKVNENLTWDSILKESGVSLNQSNIFLNTLRGRDVESQTDSREFNDMKSIIEDPLNMLLPYGAAKP